MIIIVFFSFIGSLLGCGCVYMIYLIFKTLEDHDRAIEIASIKSSIALLNIELQVAKQGMKKI